MHPLKVLFWALWGAFSGVAFAQSFALDFVDTPIADVVRSVSRAYDTPILVDGNLDIRVTFHLEGVGVLDGLAALCEAHGLELAQSGEVFHVRQARIRGEHLFSMHDSLIAISVKQKGIADFIREFGNNTGMNVLMMEGVQGEVNGNLQGVTAEEALRLLMKSNGFKLVRDGAAFRVEKAGDAESESVTADGVSGTFGHAEVGQVFLQKDSLWGDSCYSIDANEAPLERVLKELSDVANLDLALYGEMAEVVRLRLKNVPLETLLSAIFKDRRLGYSLDRKTLYVAGTGHLETLSITRLYTLKHVHTERALGLLSKFPHSSGFVAVEVKEQNSLLLNGSGEDIRLAEDLLSQVDVPALQVTLSCLIVEFKRGKNFEIGIHGGAARKTGEKNVGFRGFWDFTDSRWQKSGAFGKVGVLPDRFEMELAALEENNSAEVLARPRLATINGNKAELNVTNTVYYLVSQVSADGYPITDYRSFNDGISLEITPTVTQDGSITLEVSPEIKTAGRSTGDGPRDISTRNLKTVVVLKDGETFCLGGLIRKNKTEVRSAVPFLGSLPLVGRLFSYVSEEEEENELAIFITPHIEDLNYLEGGHVP